MSPKLSDGTGQDQSWLLMFLIERFLKMYLGFADVAD